MERGLLSRFDLELALAEPGSASRQQVGIDPILNWFVHGGMEANDLPSLKFLSVLVC